MKKIPFPPKAPNRSKRWIQFVGAAIATLSLGAHAEGADEFELYTKLSVMHDSNLFRLSRDANVLASIGRTSTSETVVTSTLGMRYDKKYSLQRVLLDVNYNKFDYQNFNYLSFAGLNYRALWDWSYTPHLHGTLSTSRNQALNSFLDFRGFSQRNERVDRNTRLEAVYELDARWRLVGGAGFNERSSDLPIAQDADYRNRALDVGLRYVMPSGSSLSYTLRRTDGDLLNRVFPSPGLNDNAYQQTDNIIEATWAVSSATSAVFRLGHQSRSHPNYPQRDFDGVTGGASFNWMVSPKLMWIASWSREISPYETFITNYQSVERFAIGPTWQLGPKTTMRAQLEHADYSYLGSPVQSRSSNRRDTLVNASVSLGWQPYQFLNVSASLQNARRSTNQPGLDFNANMVTLQAQFTY